MKSKLIKYHYYNHIVTQCFYSLGLDFSAAKDCFPGGILNWNNKVIVMAEVRHQAQVAPITKGSRNVR